MSKPFKTIDEQISILESRGLIFNDTNAAKTYLLCNNYYNVINYYSKFFMKENDRYIANTTFDEITQVYLFDKEIKSIFFKSILEIEKYFKSLISYYFTETHSEKYSYLNANNFKNDDIIQVTQIIASLSKLIIQQKKEKKPNAVKHYINQHQNVPLWILSNYMSFGQAITFYSFMRESEQNKVAKQYSLFLSKNLYKQKISISSKQIISYLNNIREIRNIVAHGNKFLGFNCRENTPYIKELHSIYNIKVNSPRQDVYNTYIVMRVFLSKHQFAIMSNSLRKRMKDLSKGVQSIDFNIVTRSLGFPNNWHTLECLSQTD